MGEWAAALGQMKMTPKKKKDTYRPCLRQSTSRYGWTSVQAWSYHLSTPSQALLEGSVLTAALSNAIYPDESYYLSRRRFYRKRPRADSSR